MNARLPSARLMWFGVLGAPAAWVTQFLVGLALSEAACNPPGETRAVSVELIVTLVSAVALAVALLAAASALAVFRATRSAWEESSAPPAGRIHFLAIVGLIVAPMMLAIIVLNGIGLIVLDPCRQG